MCVDVDVEAPVYVDVDVFRRCRCRCVLHMYTEMCFADVFSRSYKTYRSLLYISAISVQGPFCMLLCTLHAKCLCMSGPLQRPKVQEHLHAQQGLLRSRPIQKQHCCTGSTVTSTSTSTSTSTLHLHVLLNVQIQHEETQNRHAKPTSQDPQKSS